MAEEFKPVSQSLGKSLSFGSFSGKQVIILGGVFSLTFLTVTLFLDWSVYLNLCASIWTSLTCAFLSGSHPHKYWSKLYPFVPYWVRGQARYTSPVTKAKVGRKKVKVARDTSKNLLPIEDWLELATLGRIERDGLTVGCYILGANSSKNDLSKLTIKFGFKCAGIHPLQQTQEQFETINNALGAGFKEIQDSSFTFRWCNFCNYSDAIAQLQDRLNNPVSLESEYLDNAHLARSQELFNTKRRKSVSLTVYSTFTAQTDTGEKKDWLDRFIETLGLFWLKRIENKGSEITEKRLKLLLNQAYNASLRHLQILEEMGLKPIIQSEKELWDSLTGRVGRQRLPLPHVLVLDDMGLREEFGAGVGFGHKEQLANSKNSNHCIQTKNIKPVASVVGDEIHATSRLLCDGVPFADRRWVCISDKGKKKKYVGVLVLEQKPEGFWGDKGQIQYLWNVLARDNIYDVEVITEVTPANQNLVRAAQQLLTRNALSRDLQAQKQRTIEVSAQINTERSVEAQARLYTGDVPLNTSVVVLVYRNSPQELDEACRYISGLVKQPASLVRETEYTWLIWLQTLGIRRQPMLTSPYYRRLQFFASEVSGVCNLVKVAGGDKQGFELIAHESGSSVKIDLSKFKNVLVLGTAGSGKSVLVASMIAECLAQGMSFLIIDLPNADGSGTFGDFTPYFNGFYFDISRESNNLLQLPDLSCIASEEERQERIQAHQRDVNLIVTQLVLGSQSFDGFLVQTIESLIPLGVKTFYENLSVQERFAAAEAGGLGSQAWEETPTLVDLMTFFSSEFISLGYEDENVDKALNYIRLRLQYWLTSPVGQAIARPSTFDTGSQSSKLITFALTNLQSDEEAEVFGLSAYMAASRQSLSSLNSALFMDEASVLLRFVSLSRLIGRKCATARKAGGRVFLAGQDVESIASSEAGVQILQNMSCRLIGRIVPGAAHSFTKHLGIPEEIISENESFEPNVQQSYTRWLLDSNNTYTTCRYYPSYPILALTANSREEQAMRDSFKAKYPDKFDWLTEYWHYYKNCMRQKGTL